MDPALHFEQDYSGKRVLVTGHTGFTGGWLVCWLQQLGTHCNGLSLEPNTEPSLYRAISAATRIESHIGNINCRRTVDEVFERVQPEIVFHLAAQPLVSKGYKDPLGTFETNIMGTAHILEAARQNGACKAVVCITTDKVYLNAEDGQQFVESDKLGGKDPYSSSKAGAEMVASSYIETLSSMANEVQIGVARGGNIVGGGDWSDDRIIPDFVRALRGQKTLSLRHPGAVRPWQHVLCLVHGYLCLGAHLLAGKGAGHWNFGPSADDMRTVRELVGSLSSLWGAPDIDFNKGVFKEAKLLLLSSGKARSELGWEPAIDFAETVKFTVDWYQEFYSCEQDIMSICMRQISQYRQKLLESHAV